MKRKQIISKEVNDIYDYKLILYHSDIYLLKLNSSYEIYNYSYSITNNILLDDTINIVLEPDLDIEIEIGLPFNVEDYYMTSAIKSSLKRDKLVFMFTPKKLL